MKTVTSHYFSARQEFITVSRITISSLYSLCRVSSVVEQAAICDRWKLDLRTSCTCPTVLESVKKFSWLTDCLTGRLVDWRVGRLARWLTD